MSASIQCLNCRHLGQCPDTDEEKLRTQYHCVLWEGAPSEIVHARNDFITNFGDAALTTLLTTDTTPKED